jgi:hypothetical protein
MRPLRSSILVQELLSRQGFHKVRSWPILLKNSKTQQAEISLKSSCHLAVHRVRAWINGTREVAISPVVRVPSH